MTQRSRSWQAVMWREWRDCTDDVVTSNLGELLFDERITWASVARAATFWAAATAPMMTIAYFAEKDSDVGRGSPVWFNSLVCFVIPTLCVVLFRLTRSIWRAWFDAWGVAIKVAAVSSGIVTAIFSLCMLPVSLCAPDLRVPSDDYSMPSLALIPVAILFCILMLFLNCFFPLIFTIICISRFRKTDTDSSGWKLSASVARCLPIGWGPRTTLEEVRTAVAEAAKERGHGAWYHLSECIAEAVEPGQSLEELAGSLRKDNWMERYAARFGIVGAGGDAVRVLRPLIQQKGDRRAQKSAVGLLREIARRTRDRLEYRAFGLACPEHLVRCHPHRERVTWRSSVTYYGCRACHQSNEFLECWSGIVAVLDARTQEPVAQDGGSLRVNWLSFGTTFDFDRVEIIDATQEDVERFIVQVGNDTDPVRLPRYRRMNCTIAADCPLPEITKRVLRHTFRRVVQRG